MFGVVKVLHHATNIEASVQCSQISINANENPNINDAMLYSTIRFAFYVPLALSCGKYAILLNISKQFNAQSILASRPVMVALTIITAIKFIVPTLLLFFFVVRTRLSVCGVFRFAALAHESVRTPTTEARKDFVFKYK